MGKFNKTGKRGMPELNTSSLPDLIFTMLFFFMIVTTMREVTLKVQFKVPQATELEKLEKKSLVSFIYIGKPMPEFLIDVVLNLQKFRTTSIRSVKT